MSGKTEAANAAPRWSLASCSGFIATVFMWGALKLPWNDWTAFSMITTAVALVHGVTAALAVLGSPLRVRMWRIQSLVAITFFAYLTWNLIVSATYIAELYGGLGRGVAVSLGLVWMIVVLFTIPLSIWGIVVSGGLRFTKRTGAGVAIALLLGGFGVLRTSTAAAATPTLEQSEDELRAALQSAIPEGTARRSRRAGRSLMTPEVVACEQVPGPDRITIAAVFLGPDSTGQPLPRVRCVQAPSLDAAVGQLREVLAEALPGPIKLDVVSGVQPLSHVVPVVDSMAIRPGLDGICEGNRCTLPWQLLSLHAFNTNRPIPVIPELRFGFSTVGVRRLLADETKSGPVPVPVDGLTRIETVSYVTDRDAQLHLLRRLREPGPETIDGAALSDAVRSAERYIHRAQGQDGRFEYKLDPFSGVASYRGFSLARQAGTTLVVCELASNKQSARPVARKALQMLASTQRKHGDISMLYYPKEKPVKSVGLGDTALSTIAFLSCRDLVGDRFDDDINRMTRFLLSMQRDNGSFHPRFNLESGEPIPGPDPLYAVGQAVFALTLLEKVTAAEQGDFVAHDEVKAAVERAMSYTANDYWSEFASDFFFMEENWHCLAARASLGHHRHEAYEDFCLNYVRYKTRLILDDDDMVDEDLVGGYGFGNVLLPHNTGSAGFAEAGSAALAIMETRGMEREGLEDRMRLVIRFLLHHQWSEVTAFASSAQRPIEGAFSEHMASPTIRIDYVQHAMAGMGHGGRMLGLLDGKSY